MAEADLGKVLVETYALLTEGVRDPASPWRVIALGTVGGDGAPSLRSVVLRGFSGLERQIDIHTDRRSAKCADLRRRNLVSLLGWDPGRRVQLRLSGTASVEVAGPVVDAAWTCLSPQARAQYAVLPGPGARLRGPDYAMRDPDEAAARAVFAVLRVSIERLEWLSLPAIPGQGLHRRAAFKWNDGVESGEWMVP